METIYSEEPEEVEPNYDDTTIVKAKDIYCEWTKQIRKMNKEIEHLKYFLNSVINFYNLMNLTDWKIEI